MAGIGEYILKIIKKLDELEKKIDKIIDVTDIQVDLSSRDPKL